MSNTKDVTICTSKIDAIEEKLIIIDSKLDKLVEIQITQAADIKHHISRTDALEAIVLPLNESRLQFLGVFKFVSVIAACGGAYTLIRIIMSFLH